MKIFSFTLIERVNGGSRSTFRANDIRFRFKKKNKQLFVSSGNVQAFKRDFTCIILQLLCVCKIDLNTCLIWFSL